MRAEIISIGTELTTGRNLDTNSQWLSARLAELGIPVAFHTTVGDDLSDNVEVFRTAANRADLVIATGGLGPTLDDLTRDALAAMAAVVLDFHPESFERIRSLFSQRQRPMPERNRVQAMLPRGAEPLANDAGTAPGIWMKIGRAWVAALPGVPTEMRNMFERELTPRLMSVGAGGKVLVERKIHSFGAGESAVEELLGDITRRGNVPEVGITVSEATVTLRVVAQAETKQAANELIAPVEQLIRQRLGNLVFGAGDDDLHDCVARLLDEKRKTLATAESLTAGQVAERLARIPGVSRYLRGGIIAYVNEVKSSLLGVPPELLREHGAVSASVAEAMAVGCRQRLDTDLAVSTTGFAGPADGGEGKPVGLVFVGLAWAGGAKVDRFVWGGSRTEIQARSAKFALNVIRLWLEVQ